MVFGEILKKLRTKKGLSQEELAEILGFKGKFKISHYERGLSEPSLDTLMKLAEYFDVTIDYLLGKENDTWNEIIETTKKFEQYKKEIEVGKEIVLDSVKKDVLNTVFKDKDGNDIILSEHDQEEIIKAISFRLSAINKMAETRNEI